ncbi:hypothetical protein IQ246_14420 [aff. Roholtiella sp. LEGE 12411]|nr:hypothetical protein [aff. Roholtiella sp. LEGE 12411]
MNIINRIQFLLPILFFLIAIASALIVGAIFILLAVTDIIIAYTAFFQEFISTYFGFGSIFTKLTPDSDDFS